MMMTQLVATKRTLHDLADCCLRLPVNSPDDDRRLAWTGESCLELVDDSDEVVGEAPSGFRDDAVRDHLVVCLGNAAGHAGKGVGVSSQ